MSKVYGALKFKSDASVSSIISLGNKYDKFYCCGEEFQGFERPTGTNRLYYLDEDGERHLVYDNGSWIKDYYRTVLFYEKDSKVTYDYELTESSLFGILAYQCDETFFSLDTPNMQIEGLLDPRGAWVFAETIEYGVKANTSITLSVPFFSGGSHSRIDVSYDKNYGWRIKYDGVTVYSNLNGWSDQKFRTIVFSSNIYSFHNESNLNMCAFLLANASENVIVRYKDHYIGATVGSRIALICNDKYMSEHVSIDVAPCVGSVEVYYRQKGTKYKTKDYFSETSKGQNITVETYQKYCALDIVIVVNK